MEELLPYYERELGIFRAYSGEFAQRYPKTAGQLLIAGGRSEDPHIERLIQSFALLTALCPRSAEANQRTNWTCSPLVKAIGLGTQHELAKLVQALLDDGWLNDIRPCPTS